MKRITFLFLLAAVLIPLVTAQCFGVASLGRLMGIILTSDAIGQAFAPVIVGRLFDLHRNYDFGFLLLTAAALLAAIAATQIRQSRSPDAGHPPAQRTVPGGVHYHPRRRFRGTGGSVPAPV